MSTKSSLYYDSTHRLHLYTEGFDTDNVYLEVDTEGTQWSQNIVITIPLTVWAQMRTHTMQPQERYLSLTYSEMLGRAREAVRVHREQLEMYKDSPLARFFGALTFGPPEDTENTMVENYMRAHWKGTVPAEGHNEFTHGSTKPTTEETT